MKTRILQLLHWRRNTGSPSVVTTVTVSPSSFSANTGATQQLTDTVKNQSGTTMPGETVTWSTSNAAVATVNSTGLVTAVASGSATITATSVTNNTKTGTSAATISSSLNPSTGAGIGGSNGAVPIDWDAFYLYTNDAALRAAMASTISVFSDSTKQGTGTGSSKYNDGRYVDFFVLDTGTTILGNKTLKMTITAQNTAAETPTGELSGYIPGGATPRSLWLYRRVLYQNNFTAVGDADNGSAITYNGTQNASYKTGFLAGFSNANGRSGQECFNGTGTSAQCGIGIAPQYTSGFNEGYAEAVVDSMSTRWTGTTTAFDEVLYLEGFDSGTPWVATRRWVKLASDPVSNYVRTGMRNTCAIGDSQPAPLFKSLIFSGLNYNQSRKTNLNVWYSEWAAWDPLQDASSADPFNIIANYENAQTPDTPSAASEVSLVSGTLTSHVTCGKYTAKLRAKKNGTFVVGQDYTVPRTVAETTINGGTQNVASPTLTSVSSGDTVKWFAMNGNGTLESTGAPTITVS